MLYNSFYYNSYSGNNVMIIIGVTMELLLILYHITCVHLKRASRDMYIIH